MRFECLWMDGFYGKIWGNVLNFTCFDVIPYNLGQRRTDVPGTEGSLKVREVDYGYLCVSIAFKGLIADTQNNRLEWLGGPPSSCPRGLTLSKEGFDCLKIPLNSFLAFLERLYVLLHGLEIVRWLRGARLRPKKDQKSSPYKYP